MIYSAEQHHPLTVPRNARYRLIYNLQVNRSAGLTPAANLVYPLRVFAAEPLIALGAQVNFLNVPYRVPSVGQSVKEYLRAVIALVNPRFRELEVGPLAPRLPIPFLLAVLRSVRVRRETQIKQTLRVSL